VPKAKARKTAVVRVWANETGLTGRICARIPHALRDRLRYYVELTNQTTTDAIEQALQEYLQKRGY